MCANKRTIRRQAYVCEQTNKQTEREGAREREGEKERARTRERERAREREEGIDREEGGIDRERERERETPHSDLRQTSPG